MPPCPNHSTHVVIRDVNTPDWFDRYKLGVPLIDADHLSLFQEVARFEKDMEQGMAYAGLDRSLTFLYKYVGAHFAREEQLMLDCGYPRYGEHKAVHHHLKKVVFAVRKIFQEAPERVDKQKLRVFLNDWLRNHILTMDTALAPFIEGPYADSSQQEVLAVPSLQEKVHEERELIAVSVKVPADKVGLIERCAYVFTHGTPEAHDLEDIAIKATGMSLDEALSLARAVLKTDA